MTPLLGLDSINNILIFSSMYRQIQIGQSISLHYNVNDKFLYKLRKLCVILGEHGHKLNWDAHYNKKTRQFVVENTLIVLQKYFYSYSLNMDVDKYINSCMFCAISKPLN